MEVQPWLGSGRASGMEGFGFHSVDGGVTEEGEADR